MSDGSYFDNAPHQSEFGVNQDGETFNDPGEAAQKAIDNCVLYKTGLATGDFAEKTETVVGGLFDGEVCFDDLFEAVDSGLTLAVSVIESVEFLAATLTSTSDPGGLLGDWVSNLAGMGMAFLLEYVQPIQDLVGMCSGNPERIRVSASMWKALADGLAPTGTDLLAQAERLGDAWHDDASDAARLRLAEANDIILVIVELAVGVAGALEFSACLFDKIQGFMMNRVADVIGLLLEFVVGGAPKWPQLLIECIPLFLRIILELVQLAMHVVRSFTALVMLLVGADAAVDRMLPYLERMSQTGGSGGAPA